MTTFIPNFINLTKGAFLKKNYLISILALLSAGATTTAFIVTNSNGNSTTDTPKKSYQESTPSSTSISIKTSTRPSSSIESSKKSSSSTISKESTIPPEASSTEDDPKVQQSTTEQTPIQEPEQPPKELTNTAYVFVPANSKYQRIDWVPQAMGLPIYVNIAPPTDGSVWVDISYGNQGDQSIVANQLKGTIDQLRQSGYNRFVLGFASMSGLAAESFLSTFDAASLGITDVVLISGVTNNIGLSPSTVNAHYVVSNSDTTVPPSNALLSQSYGWKSTDVTYGVETHNQILYSQATLDAFNKTR